MNKEKIIEAIDKASSALDSLKAAFVEELQLGGLTEPQNVITNKINTELLAKKVAYAYNTMHPEYRVDSQFKNLSDMVNGPKMSYVINWLQKKNIEGIEDFFRLTKDNQRTELQNALKAYETEIKEVFTKRFAQ